MPSEESAELCVKKLDRDPDVGGKFAEIAHIAAWSKDQHTVPCSDSSSQQR